MNNTKISVVLPCYNVEKYIRKGLESILAQTFQEWEAIMVDDGATDNTGIICDEYAAKDSRFRVIHTQNQGVSCARNTGIKEAKGEYLYFMDPDDWIDTRCLEIIFNKICETRADAVQFCYHSIDEMGNKSWEWNDENKKEQYCCVEIIRDLLPRFLGFAADRLLYYGTTQFYEKTDMGCVWRWLFRKDIIINNKLKFPSNIKLGEDRFFLCEYLIYSKKAIFIKDYLYTYLVRKDGGLTKNSHNYNTILRHKLQALQERERLKDIVLSVSDIDISDKYAGSIVLSVLQLAVQLSSINLIKQIQGVCSFVREDEVKVAIDTINTERLPLKIKLPVLLLKWKQYRLLCITVFLCIKSGVIKANPW